MLASVKSFGLVGIDSYLVLVESDISRALPAFDVVGLPDAAVKESRDRVKSAIKNAGMSFPDGRVIVNLAPADTKKVGAIYDLPILVAILISAGSLDAELSKTAFFGELSLGGELRPATGVLPMILDAKRLGVEEIIIPFDNAAEGAVVSGLDVYPARDVGEVLAHIRGQKRLKKADTYAFPPPVLPELLDLADVRGQAEAKRALTVAAAGGHNLLMIGPPGSGKSMLAKRLPSILPDLSEEEKIETTKIHSAAGFLPRGVGLVAERPFRAPHHTVSPAGLSGGGSAPRPGEVSLAHNGVLFLDELPEFSRQSMEVMRQPVEDGFVTISRVNTRVTYPSSFMLVAAMNPCPCGYFGHPKKPCTCSEAAITRYLSHVSGPLLDRIDIHVEVPPVDYESLSASTKMERSEPIRKRVAAARELQRERYRGRGIHCNALIPRSLLDEVCPLDEPAKRFLGMAFDRMGLSARGYDRILKVSRTIADLSGAEVIGADHISEAIQYRTLDRKYWHR